MELKDGLLEMKQQNQMKGDVIAKAQRIIERMTHKSDDDEKVLKRINDQKVFQKREIMEKTKSIQ